MDFRAHLRKLAAVEEPRRSVVTLALDVSKAGIPKPTRVFLKDEVYPRLRAAGLTATARRLKAYLEGLERSVDGLFLVAGEAVWEPLELAQPLRNFLHIDRRPYLAPLFEHAARGARAAVVLVDGKQAVLREVHAGRASEVALVRRERLVSDPEKAYNNVRHMRSRVDARQGVQGGAERDLYLRAVEETFRNMIREAAKRVAEHHRQAPLERVYFAGSAEHVDLFRQRLPSPLRGVFRHLASEDRVVEETAKAYEEETARRVEEFESFREQGVGTAVGPQAVLDRLAAGELDRVFLDPDDPVPGRACLQCGARFAARKGACPFCGGALEERSLTQEVVAHAMAHPPLEILFVRGEWIRKAGGMAGVVRTRGAKRKKTG